MREILNLIRFNSPVGTFLLFFPCAWGLALAGVNDYSWYLLFLLGSFVMRSAGCIINDYFDRDIDRFVARTKFRPLASGNISTKRAFVTLFLLLLVGLLVLLQLNIIAIKIGFFSVILVILYPLAKRFIMVPQLILGFTFNIGVLVAYAAVTKSISNYAILLYLSGVLWTMGYDTIYGFQDINDDKKLGVKSMSIVVEKFSRLFLFFCYFIQLMILIFIGLNFYFLGLIFAILAWQAFTLNITDQINCMTRFKSNFFVGLLITIALLI